MNFEKNDKQLTKIITALAQHENAAGLEVLERIGTNCSDDEVRTMTAKALVNRNTTESLSIVMTQPGKGINDLNTCVAMGTINAILALQNKENVMKVLAEAEENSQDERVRDTARSIKTLMALS